MTDKRKTQLREAQQVFRDKQKRRKAILKQIIELFDEYKSL